MTTRNHPRNPSITPLGILAYVVYFIITALVTMWVCADRVK